MVCICLTYLLYLFYFHPLPLPLNLNFTSTGLESCHSPPPSLHPYRPSLTILDQVPRNEQPHLERPAYFRQLSNSKSSLLSITPSFEADDEDSLTVSSTQRSMQSSHGMEEHRGKPAYSGEDTRLTSKKELLGWYSYGFAAEVFVVCGVGSFIPIILEQLVRERGVLLSDRTRPCQSGFERPTPSHDNTNQCIFQFFGVEMNTASFAMYTFSFSVLIQALLVSSIHCLPCILIEAHTRQHWAWDSNDLCLPDGGPADSRTTYRSSPCQVPLTMANIERFCYFLSLLPVPLQQCFSLP